MKLPFDTNAIIEPNTEMVRLRAMLDGAGIEWVDNSDCMFCRTQSSGDEFSAINGRHAYGEIELWTESMILVQQDPIGLYTAEEAFELIREEVGA